jgi:hypothetical protein
LLWVEVANSQNREDERSLPTQKSWFVPAKCPTAVWFSLEAASNHWSQVPSSIPRLQLCYNFLVNEKPKYYIAGFKPLNSLNRNVRKSSRMSSPTLKNIGDLRGII